MNARTFIALALCLLAAERSWSATAEDKEIARVKARVKKTADKFYTVEYATYTVKTDINPQFTAETAVYMRKFQAAFRSFFKPEPKLKVRPIVYIFKDRATYRKELTARGLKRLARAGGGYRGGKRRSQLFCYHNKPGTSFASMRKDTVRHEGAHQLLSYILGRHDIPVWFTEGVATFFEGWNVEKPRNWNIKRLKKTQTRFGVIRKTFGTDAFKNLSYLIGLNGDTWRPENSKRLVMQHYAEAQSFMTFLLVSPRGREFFSRIFRAVAGGKDVSIMLTPKAISGAQSAWYKDIRNRIGPPKTIKRN